MSKPLTGVWDQWCVMSARPYVKMVMTDNGEEIEQESLLNLDTCRKIVLNFGLSKDNLPCTLGHQKTTVEKAQYKTATYSAMAVWSQGQVVEFAAHGEVARPTVDDLPRADNGQAPEDGIYAYRNTVTDLGAAILEKRAVRKTSPEFVMDALNQQAQPIGPQALGLAWTDDPFLNGCEINLERFPQMRKFAKGQNMATYKVYVEGRESLTTSSGNAVLKRLEDLKNAAGRIEVTKDGRDMDSQDIWELRRERGYEEAGVEEKDSPEQKYSKIKAHFGRKAMMEAGVSDGDTPDVGMAKFAKHYEAECREVRPQTEQKFGKNTYHCDECGEEVGDDGYCHKHPQATVNTMPPRSEWKVNHEGGPEVKAGVPTMVDPGEPTDKVVGGHAMERDTMRAMSEKIKQDRVEIQTMQRKLAEMERAQRKEHATKAVESAWQAGRIVPLPGESAERAKARFLVKYEKDPAMFADDLAPAGTHAVAGSLSGRMTSNGLPLNFERGTFAEEAGRPDEEIIRRAEDLRAKNPKMSKIAAVKQVCMESPELNRAYSTQSRRAAMGLG